MVICSANLWLDVFSVWLFSFSFNFVYGVAYRSGLWSSDG